MNVRGNPILAFACFLSCSISAAAQVDSRAYYRAAIAAADAKLALHDSAAAKRWLALAPAAHRGFEWRLLRRRSDVSSRVWRAGDAAINDASFSPDGRILATCCRESVTLWNFAEGRKLRSLEGHERSVWNARFDPDGKRIATIASDGKLRVFASDSGKLLRSFEGNGRGVAGLAWHPKAEHIAVCSWDYEKKRGVWGIVNVWDLASGKRSKRLEHGVKPITSIRYTRDGKWLIAGTWDPDVAVWNAESYAKVAALAPPKDEVYKATREIALRAGLAEGEHELAVAAADGTIRVWSLGARRLLRTLRRHSEGRVPMMHDVVFADRGRLLASAASDSTLRLFDAASGRFVETLHGHDSEVTALASAQRQLVSGDREGWLRVWQLDEIAPERVRWKTPDVGYSVDVTRDGQRAVATGWKGWIQIFDLQKRRVLHTWEAHKTSGVRAIWSPDAKWIASTGNDGRVVLWDASKQELVRELCVKPGVQFTAVAFDPAGKRIAAPSGNKSLGIWSLDKHELVAQLEVSAKVCDIAWGPKGRQLVACSNDGSWRLIDVRTRRVLRECSEHRGTSLFADFDPSAERFVTVAQDRRVMMWRSKDGELLREARVATGSLRAVEFSPDGTRFATSGADGSVRIWDSADCSELLKLQYPASVYDLAWNPDGNRLLAIPLDGFVRIIDADPIVRGAGLSTPERARSRDKD